MAVRQPIAGIALFAMAFALGTPRSAEAGPLLDWLFGHHRAQAPAYAVGPPVPIGATPNVVGYGVRMPITTAPIATAPIATAPIATAPIVAAPVATLPTAAYPTTGYAANYGNYYGSMMPVVGPSGYGYPATAPTGVAAATSPTILSYVPDYRTIQNRAAVTYYRPLMTTDPNTGGQVVALAPCTSYEYQAQRVPTFGYNGVLGSYSTPPVVPAPPSMPTYTLPSGGVPLAAGGPASILPPSSSSYAMGYGAYSAAPSLTAPTYSTPAYSAPSYSSNYGSYSTLQPALTAPPAGTYPTQPLSSTPGYYGSVTGGSNGGCTGSYATPYTPGLTAPQGPITSPLPSTPLPSSPSMPSTSPSFPVNPPIGTIPNDPGNTQPVLPPIGTNAMNTQRSQLRAIVRQPASNSAAQSAAQSQSSDAKRSAPAPLMDPIPAPAGLEEQPRWNPGLLNEEDRTASFGQGKTIQWASFRSNEASPSSAVEPAHAERPVQASGLRPIAPTRVAKPVIEATPPATQAAAPQLNMPKPANAQPRQFGGWKASK